jgi:hypothetical protein
MEILMQPEKQIMQEELYRYAHHAPIACEHADHCCASVHARVSLLLASFITRARL